MVLWYKNSFLASVVSILGCLMIMAAIGVFMEDVAAAIIFLVIGVAMAAWGKKISNDKAFKVWWKQVKDNGLEPVVARDLNTAIAIYQKNPDKRTVKQIEKLNPCFAEHIRKNVAGKK